MKNQLKKNSFAWLGWVVAAGMGSLMLAGGFQDETQKTGVVSILDVVAQTDFGNINANRLEQAINARNDIIEFINTNRVLTREQAEELRRLSTIEEPTQEEQQELEDLKDNVRAAYREFNELNQEAQPTDAQREMLTEYNERRQDMIALLNEWQAQFQREIQNLNLDIRQDTIDEVREATQEIAEDQGYTIVFEKEMAVYGANDLTDEVAARLNEAN
jgi:Skp family chaperone for outer membrane proteins